MHAIDYIIIIALALAVILAIRHISRNGTSCCGHNCSDEHCNCCRENCSKKH